MIYIYSVFRVIHQSSKHKNLHSIDEMTKPMNYEMLIHHVDAEADLLLHGLVADVDLLRVQPLPRALTEVLLSRHVTTD